MSLRLSVPVTLTTCLTAAFSVGVPDLATHAWNCSACDLVPSAGFSFEGAFFFAGAFSDWSAFGLPLAAETALSLLLSSVESVPLAAAPMTPITTNRAMTPRHPNPMIFPVLDFFGGCGGGPHCCGAPGPAHPAGV